MPASPAPSTRSQKTTGLRYWMLQVLKECDRVSASFSPDPVHDLRVALRRCRSLADGLMALDPNPEWKAMKKAGKRLFQSLGSLRDTQVMLEWVEKLEKARMEQAPSPTVSSCQENSPLSENRSASSTHAEDAPAQALLKILKGREAERKTEAQAALDKFNRKQWRRWSNSLPAHGARIRPGNALFKHLALERWVEARRLHTMALRNRSQITLHRLRIGIKRLRYIVENFLPQERNAWSDDLKKMQDLLGEVHDLDVLWSTAISCRIFPDDRSRRIWHECILAQRTKHIEGYRAKMTGKNSLWEVWRAALPQGRQIKELADRRLKLWMVCLDPDVSHSIHVAELALQLYKGLTVSELQPTVDPVAARSCLYTAALLHDVGRSKGEKNHRKKSFKLIQAHGTPLGWKPADFRRSALVAHFHGGALPTRRHKLLRDLPADERNATIQLSAILRLANALDVEHDGSVRQLRVETNGRLGRASRGCVIVSAQGYSPYNATARASAAERHLLETILRQPIVINRMRSGQKPPTTPNGPRASSRR